MSLFQIETYQFVRRFQRLSMDYVNKRAFETSVMKCEVALFSYPFSVPLGDEVIFIFL